MRAFTIQFWLCICVIVFTATSNAFGFDGKDEDGVCPQESGIASYAQVTVTAHSRKEGVKKSAENEIEARVYLNDAPVGGTPYEDCLPEGVYVLVVRMNGHDSYKRTLQAEPGKRYSIAADFVTPLTDKERIEAVKKKKKEAKLKLEREQKAKRKAWKAAKKKWQVEAAPVIEQRKPSIQGRLDW